MSAKSIRFVIVEDEALVSRMLSAWLEQHRELKLVGCAQDGEEGLALCHAQKPDVALVDVMMPKMDGLELATRLRSELPDVKIVILSARIDPYCLYRINRLGVHGYVDKASPPELVADAMLRVVKGSQYRAPHVEERWQRLRQDPDAFFKILSDREIEVVRQLSTGKNLRDISTALGIAYETIRAHKRNIHKKLNVHGTLALLALARTQGLH